MILSIYKSEWMGVGQQMILSIDDLVNIQVRVDGFVNGSFCQQMILSIYKSEWMDSCQRMTNNGWV
jgi:hypothetical protein